MLKCLFQTNAVLINETTNEIIKKNQEFDFLNQTLQWIPIEVGSYVEIGAQVDSAQEQKALQTVRKFGSLIIYRNAHVERFDEIFNCFFSQDGSLGKQRTHACLEPRFILRGNEKKFDSRFWNMISFYAEAKNSSSIFYKFICLYKIIQINNLKKESKNGKNIFTEDKRAVGEYINNEIINVLTKKELTQLRHRINPTKIKDKSVAGYLDHLLRDAFSHVGVLVSNKYPYGYPTVNPLNPKDVLKYNSAVTILEKLVRGLLVSIEPKV